MDETVGITKNFDEVCSKIENRKNDILICKCYTYSQQNIEKQFDYMLYFLEKCCVNNKLTNQEKEMTFHIEMILEKIR